MKKFHPRLLIKAVLKEIPVRPESGDGKVTPFMRGEGSLKMSQSVSQNLPDVPVDAGARDIFGLISDGSNSRFGCIRRDRGFECRAVSAATHSNKKRGLSKGPGALMGLKGDRDVWNLWRDDFRENAR